MHRSCKTRNLYGTAYAEGTYQCGVVFKVDANGNETVLHEFMGGASDGEAPFSSLLLDKAGNLYGTTELGGTYGSGTVFKLEPSGKLILLYSFTGSVDGAIPAGGLIRDKLGNFYGTTEEGGSSGAGNVFRLSKKGKLTTLHSFNGTDGMFPTWTNLIRDKQGNIFGVTLQGGASNFGVVYKLNQKGKFTLLHSFTGGTNDGCQIYGIPAMDKQGNIYGTAEACGANSYGLVWKVTPQGAETILHAFEATDGAFPYAGVVLDGKGNLYGNTQVAAGSYGTVFQMSVEGGGVTVLHNFEESDGANPYGGVIYSKGKIYGTTGVGGSSSYGTVWVVAP
jgi:uncharacterized repeat protein (TIGR03803 family)